MMRDNDLAAIARRLEQDIDRCLESLSGRLQVGSADAGTHQLLTIIGIDCSQECLQDLAVYCVGQIAKAVQVNLEIKADLLGIDNEDVRVHLINDVYSVIGENNDALTDLQKRNERDPWLFEALSHLFVHLSTGRGDFLPVGIPIGLTMTHRGVNQPGLDLVAIYASTALGLSVGESKAREDDPSKGLREAAKRFGEVDLGNYDQELRTIVGQMRYAIPIEYQEQITGVFWRDERAYLPFICYDSRHNPRWADEREALRPLNVPATHIILVPLPIENFRKFFDDLADAMRTYLATLEG
jgi:hypothetical protein